MVDAALQKTVSGVADSTGACTITTGPTESNTTWTIDQVSVNAVPATPGSCTAAVYLNQVLVCASIAGQQDAAAGDPPIIAQPGAQIAVQWTGAVPSSQCTALLTGTQTYPG
jgi:hypothetical protein